MAELSCGGRRDWVEEKMENDEEWIGPLPPEDEKPKKRKVFMLSPKRLKRLVFRRVEDISLLKEVVARNPFRTPRMWDTVARNLNDIHVLRTFTVRAVKERCIFMLQVFQHEDRMLLRKSGTEDQYDEIERLLAIVVQLCDKAAYRILPLTASRRRTLRAIMDLKTRNNADQTAEILSPTPSTSSCSADCLDTILEQIRAEIVVSQGDEHPPESSEEVSLLQGIEDAQSDGSTVHDGSAEEPAIPKVSERRQFHPLSNAVSAIALQQFLTKKKENEDVQQADASKYTEQRLELKKEQLELEKRQLDFEERRFEANQLERQRQWDLIEAVHADQKRLMEFAMNGLADGRK